MSPSDDSPLLRIPHSAWTHQNALAFAVRDPQPVSEGHTLAITKQVVPSWFEASEAEQHALLALVALVKAELDSTLRPDGYNVGFNLGSAAGESWGHLHLHVIPRFRGDVDDPRGGVRNVIPSGGRSSARPALATGGIDDPFARHILPLIDRVDHIGIVAAFVQASGLKHLEAPLIAAVDRGAQVRIVTGDYLEITQVEALERLLDLQSGITPDDAGATAGRLEARVIESSKLPHPTRSFHPKCWWFESATEGVAFVGSSNLSYAALRTGIEWNLRVERGRPPGAYGRVRSAFEDLWEQAAPLNAPWIEAYAARAALRPNNLPPGEIDLEPVAPPHAAHQVQLEALAELRRSREAGRRRALVVMATGLGKTWLAAYDFDQLRDELGRPPRLLFIAHRREILIQAASTYRALLRQRNQQPKVGWCMEAHGNLSAQLVFASVAKLARPDQLAQLKHEHFDYVVVDEVHHAAADSYRRILGAMEPGFLLGLTATPDRSDAADIEGLFDDHVAYRAGVDRGIALGRLVPFHYFGVKDDIDYANIPWRNRRFDPELLADAAQTEARMRSLWRAWEAHPANRSVVFCCSIAHARFVKDWLKAKGLRVMAVFSAEGSDDRETALHQLARGEVDAVCAVDVINEGVEVNTNLSVDASAIAL